MNTVGAVSYLLAGGVFLVFGLLLLTSWRGRFQGGLLIIAVFVSATWGAVTTFDYYTTSVPEWMLFLVEIIRYSAWLAFMTSLLTISKDVNKQRLWVAAVWMTGLVCGSYGMFFAFYLSGDFFVWGDNPQLIYIALFLSLAGLVAVEQLYRNRTTEASSSIGYLCMALGIIFAFDIYTYSNAALFSTINENIWSARGIINAGIVPLLALSARHNPDLTLKVFVSRKMVFYTTSLVGSGLYLLAVAFAGYYIQLYGGEWGAFFQIIFLSGAVLMLAMVLSSPTSRARLRIFLNKHFYSNKYEYREQWMRLTKTLTEESDTNDFNKRVVFALTDILDAKGGALWLEQETTGYICVSHLNMRCTAYAVSENEDFIKFMKQKNWIIDMLEFQEHPEVYGHLQLPEWLQQQDDAWLLLPLPYQNRLIGFVIIGRSSVSRSINWEDRDLLKMAAHQTASYLALIAAKEELDRAHQFDAFNRLSAFVVHDLKNLVAQLGLVVENAAKHKNNPAFMDDAIKTVENAVAKMDRLLAQLRKTRFEKRQQNNIIINATIREAIGNTQDMLPEPEYLDYAEEIEIYADKDRFCSILEHLIRNAQEATADDGFIRLRLTRQGDFAVLQIEDNGAGMDKDFVQNKLFRPFYTTKGNAGMGIGAYEARQMIQQMGGTLQVASEVDMGTTFRIQLPIVLS